jgi:antitoxin MazE
MWHSHVIGIPSCIFVVDTLAKLQEDAMRARVARWGNSLALRIPSGIAEDAQLVEGSEVEVAVRDGRIVLEPVVSLAALVARITPENLPDLEFPDDAPRGGEVW